MKDVLRAKLLVPILTLLVVVITDIVGVPLSSNTLWLLGITAITIFTGEEFKDVKEIAEKYRNRVE